MSTTECITQTSLSPTNAANVRRPLALGETSNFWHADGQRLHRHRAQQRALGAAQAQHALHASFGEQPNDQRAHAVLHQRDGRAARAGAADLGQRVVAGGRDLLVREVGSQPGSPRIPESITITSTRNASSRSRT